MKVLSISASNMIAVNREESTSYKICTLVGDAVRDKGVRTEHSILELKNHFLLPCVGCGQCWRSHRCVQKDDFNEIYEQIIACNLLLFVSPHYAPIPAKLAALLEKMEQITFLHSGADSAFQSEVCGKITGVISHGGGADWALKSYKLMVNDTIANALDTIQLKLIPFNDEWNTGISLPVSSASFSGASIFPRQEYNWEKLKQQIADYTEILLQNV